MSESAIRTAIYNAANGVSNVGAVNDYQRWINDWGDYLSKNKTTIGTTAQIRVWELAYRGFRVDEPRQFQGLHLRIHRFALMGYLGLDDSAETEKTMAALAETVANAIEDDATLAALAFYDVEIDMIFEPRVYGGVLCHYVEMTIEAGETV